MPLKTNNIYRLFLIISLLIIIQWVIPAITFPQTCTDSDSDTYAVEGGVCGSSDCDDTDSQIYPGGPPVRIVRVSAAADYFSTLQEAYDAAGDEDIIHSRNTTLEEDLLINRNVSLTMSGGYNCGYSAIADSTILNGNVTVQEGTVTIGDGIFVINKPDSSPRVVTSVTRISHPAYDMNNYFGQGGFNSWNVDHTRILMNESEGFCDPVAGCGRGIVVGMLYALKDAAHTGDLQDYLSATVDIPDSIWYSSSGMEWSPFTGEEEYIYGLRRSDEMLIKYNIDTGEQTPVISISHADLTQSPTTLGWTTDNKLIVNFMQSDWLSGLWEINVDHPAHAAPTRTYYASRPNQCSERFANYPYTRTIHQGKSPDSKYYATYNGSSANSGVYSNDYTDPDNCGAFFNDGQNGSATGDYLTHISWESTNDWFIGASASCQFTNPNLKNFRISQIFFNRAARTFSHNNLITIYGASAWRDISCQGDFINEYNYHALPAPTLRDDAMQIMYFSTDGKYSKDDYDCCMNGCPDTTIPQDVCDAVTANWGTKGIFLADIAVPQCNNGIDDDLDGNIDMTDADCTDMFDNSESIAIPSLNSSPELLIYKPDGIDSTASSGASYAISYNLIDSDDIVSASFYYDTDNTGYDGTPIITCSDVPEGYEMSCSWDTGGIPAGVYYVYGIVDDGVNPPVKAYSEGSLIVTTGDTLYDPNHTSIASENPDSGASDILMQRFEVFSDNEENGQILLTSLDIIDNGSADSFLDVKVFISSTSALTLPEDAVLIGNSGQWDGSPITIPLYNGTAEDRTVYNGDSKYIYIAYDLDAGQGGKTIQSSIRALGVATPDIPPLYLGHSNLLTIQSCAQTGSITIVPEQTLAGQSIDLTSIAAKSNAFNLYYEVREFNSCEVDPDGTYIEAENYTGTISQGTGTFTVEFVQPGYLGAGYLKSNGTGDHGTCPPVNEGKEYRINFTQSGLYSVWIRSFALDNSSNSIYLGIDGNCIGSIKDYVYNQWGWTNDVQNGSTVIDVAAPGIHTLNLWVRESNYLIDGIYITQGTETPTDVLYGTVINPHDCSTPIFSGSETEAQTVDTTGWSNGQKDLIIPGDDSICLSALPPANGIFTFSVESDCTDNIDNDNDGIIDCADEDCNQVSGCEYGSELSCFDNRDNDADNVTDCADPDCDLTTNGPCNTGQDGICAAGTIICSGGLEVCMQDNLPQQEGPIIDPTCSDGIDNDCDGTTDSDPDCLCEIPLDDFTDGMIDTGLWEHIHSGDTSGSGADTYFLEQNTRLEAQAARHMTSPSAQVVNVLQTAEVSQGNFIGQDVVVQAQAYWYSDTLAAGTPPDSIARVSIVDDVNEVIVWTAPQEAWLSGTDSGFRTVANQRDNLMQFEFNASNQTVSFMEDENFIGTFDISSLNAWRIRWYTKGQSFQNVHTSTAIVHINSFQTVTITGSISIQSDQTLSGNPVDLTSVVTASYANNLWYKVKEGDGCNVDPNGTYIDTEDYSGTIIQGTSTFAEESSMSDYIGRGYLRSTGPGSVSCPPADEGKEYTVYFTESGVYMVWLRAYASSGSSDSIFIGLDGFCTGSLQHNGIYDQWIWTNSIKDGDNAVSVASTGPHTLNIWVREANHLVDGIYISKGTIAPSDSSYGTVIDPNNCVSVLFDGDSTQAQVVDTTLWVNSQKELELSGHDEICTIPLTPVHNTFNYIP